MVRQPTTNDQHVAYTREGVSPGGREGRVVSRELCAEAAGGGGRQLLGYELGVGVGFGGGVRVGVRVGVSIGVRVRVRVRIGVRVGVGVGGGFKVRIT